MNYNIPNIYTLRSRLVSLQILLQAAAATEYPADWAGGGKTVLRDGQGRFATKDDKPKVIIELKEPPTASKGSPVIPPKGSPIIELTEPPEEDEEDAFSIELKDFLEEETTTFSKSLKDFEKEQITGVDKKVLEKATDNLKGLLEKRKELAGELTDLMFGDYAKVARERLAELCKPINLELSNAIKEDPFASVQVDIQNIKDEANAGNITALLKDLPKAAEYSLNKYQKMSADLQKSTGDNSQLMQALGRTAAVAIPASIFFAATLGPLAVVPAIVGAVSHSAVAATIGGIVASAAVWKVKDKALEEGLDILDVENPVVRNIAKIGAFGAAAPFHALGAIPWVGSGVGVAASGLLELAALNPVASTIGRIVLPGQNFSGKSQAELKELKDVKDKAEKALDKTSKEAIKANQQLEEVLSSLQDFPLGKN